MGVWCRRGEAASTRLSAAPYSAHHKLYSEAVISSAVALAEVGRFREAVQYVQRAAKALYEAAKDVFEQVKVTVQRLVELFVEAVTRVLAWIDEHKAYLFLMAAAAAGVIALATALNLWGLVELEKLAHAASAAPFFPGRTKTGEKAAEWFKTLAERYERWRMDESLVDGVLKVPLRGEWPYKALLKLAESANLLRPLAELRKALARVEDEAEKDAAVDAALVLYKTLVKNAGVYREWAEVYHWARGLVERQEFVATASDIKRLRETHRRLEEAAEEVRRELNAVLTLYASHSRELYEKLRPHLEVDVEKAEELAEARSDELSKYSDTNMGTKAYAALLSIAKGGIYGHAAMLLMGEGALVDIVLSAPKTAYNKADDIAGARGEAVDPSRSRRRAKAEEVAGGRGGAVDLPHVEEDWKDRAASVLLQFLIGYGKVDPRLLSGAGEVNLRFRRVERRDEKGRVERGFQVSRVYGGVEAPVGELWIGKTAAYFNVSEEELRRLVEEARKTAPDLSGLDKAPQYLEWRATDVTTSGERIAAATAHSWQLRWYFSLLGDEQSISGSASVTKEGIKPVVTAFWPREREDQILRESRWLESLLGRRVESWRELVDAINWSWVVEKVEKLVDELKPWMGRERMSDVEREGLVRRMLGELALLAHFAEARRGMDDDRWREERVKRLSRAVEALSGRRIASDQAEELAKLIISYAKSRKESVKNSINELAGKLAGVSSKEVWEIVEFVLSDMYCLAKDCARDAVVRKFVAPALELIMLDKALNDNNESNRERAKLLFGEMYATAVAGDGTVGRRLVALTVGGELGGGAALLRLATLHLLNQLLSDEWKFGVRVYMGKGRYYSITAYGGDAARFMRLLAVSAPSAGGEYLSEKFNEFVETVQIKVWFDKNSIRRTGNGNVAADLTISEGDIEIKYNVYLSNKVALEFRSADRSRAELAARMLRHAGVSAEVKKKKGKNVWYVKVSTDKLAAGREELRKALAEFVRSAVKNEKKAERWLKKLERGRVLMEGWPKYKVRLVKSALEVSFSSPNLDSLKQAAQRLTDMGLEEGIHFTVKMPEEGRYGYVYILKEGLAYAAWLSINGSGDQQRLAADFVELILQRAKEKGDAVSEKAQKIIEEGKAWGSQTLEGFEKRVEVGGRELVVKVIGGGAKLEESWSGKKLLRLTITAEVDGVRSDYTITYGRYGRTNAAVGYAYVRADAPDVREKDAERLAAVVEALTGVKPRIRRRSDGKIEIECYEGHLEGFMLYKEFFGTIMQWLKDTSRRGRDTDRQEAGGLP
jgi:hypothetical protein